MRHFKKIDWPLSLSLLFACVLTVIAACVEPSGPLGAPNVIESGKVSSVQITLAQSALAPGQTTQATAIAKSADGQVVTGRIDFSSQDTTIAKVSPNGVVTALAPGIVLIQATMAGCVGTTPVMVKALFPAVAVVSVAVDSTSLLVGHAAKATAIAKDSSGAVITGESVTWASQSPTIATVSSDGTVTAVAPGLVKIQATIAGKAGTASLTVLQISFAPVTTVTVAIDSTTLLVGHVGHALATAKDASGNIVTNATVTWASLTPGVATVSASGAVTAVSEGPAVIKATVSGIAGTDSLVVVVPPNLASQNFDGGSYAPYYNYWDPAVGGNGDVDVVGDPTGAGKGKVARMHYYGSNGDRNRHLLFQDHIDFGMTRYMRGEFYLDVADLGDGLWGRKLMYFRPNEAGTKYGGAWREFAAVVGFQGNSLYATSFYVPAGGSVVMRNAQIATGILPRTWYTLEIQITMESSIGAGDGIFRVWLNNALIYSITDMELSDPAWVGIPIPGGNATPYELVDCYLAYDYVGDQVNLNNGSYDEYRYWDNVAVSTKRIGH